jgi:SAM-dependent methyltransferase
MGDRPTEAESRAADVARALAAAARETGYAYPDRENRLEDMVFMFEKRASEAQFYNTLLDVHVGTAKHPGLALDVGCGLGAYVDPLRRRYAHPFFVDSDSARVAMARAKYDAPFFTFDLFDDAPLARDVEEALTGAFSLVQCIQVLGHIETVRVVHALTRMCSLLDDDGVLLFAVPFTGAPFDDFWITFLDGEKPRPMPTDVRKYDRLARHPENVRLPVRHFALETLHALLDESGLSPVVHQPYNWFSDVRGDLFMVAKKKRC